MLIFTIILIVLGRSGQEQSFWVTSILLVVIPSTLGSAKNMTCFTYSGDIIYVLITGYMLIGYYYYK